MVNTYLTTDELSSRIKYDARTIRERLKDSVLLEGMRITQERIAGLLGVRREGVTAAALQLQRQGLVHYRRGHIRVLDRRGLEQHSCECYGVVARAYEQLRNHSPAWPHPCGGAERANEVSRWSEDVSVQAALAPLAC